MSYSDNYNAVDRLLHRIAFASPLVQKVLTEVENDLFRKDLQSVESRNEVFITGLPRAGTTLMLELLHGTGEFQAFTYRQMPFILAPLLWDSLSRSSRKAGRQQERAHGDGMTISVDSPEAFDEVIWLTYMGKKIVGRDRLEPVSRNDVGDEFIEAMRNAIRKLLALARRTDRTQPVRRYLSKNNAHISRIDALLDIFPTSQVLVIFRNPLAHVASLATQHERFSREHENDAFSRNYMKWIGHFEFGGNFKPINFDRWLDGTALPSVVDETFWLRYWSVAYAHALEQKTDRVHFVDFDDLLRNGERSLARIGEMLGLTETTSLLEAAKRFRSPTTRPADPGSRPERDVERAAEIHNQLQSVAL